MASRKKSRMQWYKIDLHIHTPASHDYVEPETHYIDILRRAEHRNLDIIAFSDHNTGRGYWAMMQEVERLEYLETLGRANADELRLLAEYRRLLEKILVLPGFEFTATFGFHILGIFSPQTPLRDLDHLLMSMGIPSHVLDEGSSEVGASSDVLTAYQMINQAGGICIAAHVNTTHGVAMRGMDFGGQTRVAYTQDRNLHALEATDIGRGGRRNTQRFFDGTKPEYPRRMRCIQGSDSHNLTTVRDRNGRIITLGVGERVTEVLLEERSFEALLEMFQSSDFSRSRPYSPNLKPEDFVQSAREEGESIVQSFHETLEQKGGHLYNIISDVCAFANTNGGTVYIGLSSNKRRKVVGVDNPPEAVNILQNEISSLITPPLNVDVDIHETQGKSVVRVQVPFGEDRPYAVDNSKIYVRDENDTTIAIRDEVVNLVRQGLIFSDASTPSSVRSTVDPIATVTQLNPIVQEAHESENTPEDEANPDFIAPPRAGVEIVGTEQRNNTNYYIMRDLRNGNVVKNVTRSSARRLWHYAIKQRETTPFKESDVQWSGEIGLWRRYKKSGSVRYDLVQRENGNVREYYGVTENGMHGKWGQFLAPDDDGNGS